LKRAGVTVAEVKDINAIKIISNTDYFEIDDIALSCIEAVKNHGYDSVRNDFAAKLLTRILKVKSTSPVKIEPPGV